MTEKNEAPQAEQDVSVDRKWSDLSPHSYVKIAVIAILIYLLFKHEIAGIVSRWSNDPSWSHGFLIPLFSLYFLNQKKKAILGLYIDENGQPINQTRPSYMGLGLIVFTLIFYLFNILHFQYGYFRPMCVIAMTGSVVLFIGGWRLVKHTWLAVLFLFFANPLPDRIYRSATIPMRQIAASIAATLLSLVNDLNATANGVVIDVVYKGQKLEPALDVAEACSGMRLLMAFMALGVAMAYLHYRPIWQRLVLLASTIPIAIACNIVRVTVTGFIYIMIGPKYATGLYHDLLGMLMLPLAFGLYGFLAWFMANIYVEKTEPVEQDVIVRRKK